MDASATATLNLASSASNSFNGDVSVVGNLAVNAGADADFFGLFDSSTSVELFNSDFNLFQVRSLLLFFLTTC